jgi:hypothetical protein
MQQFCEQVSVPELTRNVRIKLNSKLSLQLHITRIMVRSPDIALSPDTPRSEVAGTSPRTGDLNIGFNFGYEK